ncbi:hypothetical protein LCGC14_1490630, partial [marine sediment metagenome]
MNEFFEVFYILQPVVPFTLWNYLIIIGLIVIAWVFRLWMVKLNEKDWFRTGTKEFAKAFWRVVVLDRASLKPINLYLSGILLMIIARTGIFVAYFPTVASVSMLVITWILWITALVYIFTIARDVYRHKRQRNLIPERLGGGHKQ